MAGAQIAYSQNQGALSSKISFVIVQTEGEQ